MKHSTFLLRLFSLISFLVLFVGQVTAQDAMPRYERSACPFADGDAMEGLECGYLIVPESRDRPTSRTLRLAVAVVRSLSDAPVPDPLVFLAGGPGGSATENLVQRLRSPFWNAMRRKRDLIFMDQRGTGYSDPAFCPEMNVAVYTGSFRGLSREEQRALKVGAAKACRAQMLREGLDFSAYNSATSARDFDDLRRMLGYETWNLLGVSYGTRLALTAMRDTPDGIRSVILDSTLPPNAAGWLDDGTRFTHSLQLVFDQCAADDACHRTFPTLEEDFYTVLDSLEQRPVVLAMPDTTRFPGGRIVIDGTLLAAGIFQGLYFDDFIPVVPLMIREASLRNTEVLTALADGLVRDPHVLNMGLQYSIQCYEAIPFNPPENVDADRAQHPRLRAWYEFFDDAAICEAWHDVRADSIEIQPVQSDIPTFILAGEFDPTTPPSYGRLASETLPNSTFIEARGLGHGVAPLTECTRNLAVSFLDDPMQALDTGCLDALPPITFVTEVHLNTGIYRLGSHLQRGPDLFLLIGLGLVVLCLLSAVVAWPLGYLIQRLRHRPLGTTGTQQGARWLAWIACLLALGFLGGLVSVIMRTVAENPFVLAFGVPGGAGWLFFLPWIVLVLTLGVAVLAVLAWKRKWWTVPSRMHYVLVATACLGFVIFAGTWGLL